MENELYLTELIDREVLQRIQNAFSDMTGMAALTTDKDGVPVTEGSHFTDFCMNYTRQSELGCRRCEYCDKRGAELAMEKGTFSTYICHAGLVDFAAPIMANDQLVGSFIGGQVLLHELSEEKVRKLASDLKIDAKEYLAASKKVPVLEKHHIEKAAHFLAVITEVLSDMAYTRHQLMVGNEEVEKAIKMKSDFVANMSHEIRTPMNAVIGMAEMALREDLPIAAREYIAQIKSSGQTLLTIVNDILDFSKIESGKLSVIEEEYEPLSILNDVIGIILNRIGNKNLELTIDMPLELPYELYGDSNRIKQIIVNLMNNAVKFTAGGEVHLSVECEPASEDMVLLKMAVTDTGQGIKKADLGKLFQSFQQVDSKRNRNVEGTGLGLAISKQLLTLMNGNISVESVYEKGSTFRFELPQKIVTRKPSIPQVEKTMSVGNLVANTYIREQLKRDTAKFGVEYWELTQDELEESKIDFLFMEKPQFSEKVESYLQRHPSVTGVLLVKFSDKIQPSLSNIRVVSKPLYALNLSAILNDQDVIEIQEGMTADDVNFVAPEAQILIVDDNAINLTVAEGLLEPLHMKIDTALSGKEAISLISGKHYDLVFMDHMMPEVDGVETTHIIRRFYDDYKDVPIIALTANAVGGTKEMLVREGMNDFVPKPIEMRVICAKLKQWLPAEKIKRREEGDIVPVKQGADAEEKNIEIEGLDVNAALSLVGSKKLFFAVLKDYYLAIDKKSAMIKEYETQEKIKDYTIEVHALKSASRQIGAMELAQKAERMENAGNAGDVQLIHQCTDEVVSQYRWYKGILAPYFEEPEENQDSGLEFTQEILTEQTEKMREALDELDSDMMEEVVADLAKYQLVDRHRELFVKLKSAVQDIDTETCEAILNAWGKIEW
ncbi:MAG: PocR ligand-binding domain-containing protein [Roseburia sp.]|nr:PocR ligand-binding domain-containing protein [Roseburia sp.]